MINNAGTRKHVPKCSLNLRPQLGLLQIADDFTCILSVISVETCSNNIRISSSDCSAISIWPSIWCYQYIRSELAINACDTAFRGIDLRSLALHLRNMMRFSRFTSWSACVCLFCFWFQCAFHLLAPVTLCFRCICVVSVLRRNSL